MEYNEIVVNDCKNETIYSYLKRNSFSENYVKNLRKKEGYILKNNKIAFANEKVLNGDVLLLCKNPNTKSSIMQCIIPLDIVYEDENYLIVNKPSNLATAPSRSHYSNNLAGAVLSYMEKKDSNFVVRIINRLDKDTAGLVMIAKHSLASNYFNNSSLLKKTYYAICSGEIKEQLIINKNIATTKNEYGYNNLKREILPEGKPAITNVTPISFDGENTLCKVQITHGRTHQIRVHLASENHSLIGDELYGEKIEKISHTALLLKELEFTCPFTNKEIKLSVDFPNDFKNVFNKNL